MLAMFRRKWHLLVLQLAFLCYVCPLLVAASGAGKNIEEAESLRVTLFFVIFILLSILIEVDLILSVSVKFHHLAIYRVFLALSTDNISSSGALLGA